MYFKMAFPQSFFEMTDYDADEYFDDLECEAGDLPGSTRFNRFETDLEVGIEIFMDINPKSKDERDLYFLPKVADKKYFIPFLLGFDGMAVDDVFSTEIKKAESISEGMVSSGKCRVMIDKNILPDYEEAYFEGKGKHNYLIDVYDYGSAYCLEIPFIALFDDRLYDFERIVIVRK